MMMKRAFFALACVALASAHMWMIAPVGRGGEDDIGGTGAPCSGEAPGSGARTTYKIGEKVALQFRVNKHGPGPFKLSFSPNGDDKGYDAANNTIADNMVYAVTAGPEGFNGFNLQVTMPTVACETCSLQLRGMAKEDGTGAWYQCADISLVTEVCPNACSGHGECVANKCQCTSGYRSSWAGVDCSAAVSSSNAAVFAMTVAGAAVDSFDSTAFATDLSTKMGVPATSVTVSNPVAASGGVTVSVEIAETESVSAVQQTNIVMSQVANEQLATVGAYSVTSVASALKTAPVYEAAPAAPPSAEPMCNVGLGSDIHATPCSTCCCDLGTEFGTACLAKTTDCTSQNGICLAIAAPGAAVNSGVQAVAGAVFALFAFVAVLVV